MKPLQEVNIFYRHLQAWFFAVYLKLMKLEKFLQYIDLRNEVEEYTKIHEEIEKGIVFKGTNLWVLVFAIIVASVGLNMNSTAVIIGAMLISPLMGPINGMGYSVATYDLPLFRRSLKNFGFAVIASLFASTLYFAISPVSTAHSELLARTSPTIYDVLIALFGGLAGIVAISSRLKGNVIPGVAIATALMPPLCTAGYGLATFQFSFFFGAFYLFTINTVFIALSSVLVSQFFQFPITADIPPARKTRINQIIWTVIIITLLPSIYFGFLLVENEEFGQNAQKFTRNVSVVEGSFLLRHEVNQSEKNIVLIYGGAKLDSIQKYQILSKAKDFSLDGARITIEQGFATDIESDGENAKLQSQINALNNQLREKEVKIDSFYRFYETGSDLISELRVLYSEIEEVTVAHGHRYNDDGSKSSETLVVVYHQSEDFPSLQERQTITDWIRKRMKKSSAMVLFRNNLLLP